MLRLRRRAAVTSLASTLPLLFLRLQWPLLWRPAHLAMVATVMVAATIAMGRRKGTTLRQRRGRGRAHRRQQRQVRQVEAQLLAVLPSSSCQQAMSMKQSVPLLHQRPQLQWRL